ncbi:enolase C-terminal domain-like protein [Mycobacterium sp. 852002-51961_SCH5331710]|uniref:enolase C-terminal domain-like protein n=1 Tax=Mycobacterium sp. 852002-51961_SCH5331710 TaxID=1834105 RepID=UPI0008023E2C|nr:enolase C-terminal domain-like protein [Mycobacterium sp. 852002-51961_SCH5331710]OBB35699.1 mandelate racemase [Mycobacterium sp. 852002-51961_SCH5331710]
MTKPRSGVDGVVVESVTAAAYAIPTDAPEADGTLSWDSTTMILVQIRAGDRCGTGWTYGASVVADLVNRKLADIVVGAPAFDIAGRLQEMIAAVRNVGRRGVAGQAISAIDVALWDLKARLLQMPLHRLLGAVRDDVAVYGSGGFTSYDDSELRGQLAHWMGLCIPRVKIKIGESWGTRVDRDLARMSLTREAVGDDVELYVDANGGYERKQAVRVMQAAKAFDVRWFEEPVSSDDLDGLRSVRDAVDADVAAGEYGYDLYYFQRMCQARAVDCLQIDATRCGGLSEWLRAAAVAAAHGLEVSGHCAPYLHLHVAAATPNFRHLEWFHDHVRIEQMCFDGARDPVGGALRPDTHAPGHGLELRPDDIERFRTH